MLLKYVFCLIHAFHKEFKTFILSIRMVVFLKLRLIISSSLSKEYHILFELLCSNIQQFADFFYHFNGRIQPRRFFMPVCAS
jgi:hypothetical protein